VITGLLTKQKGRKEVFAFGIIHRIEKKYIRTYIGEYDENCNIIFFQKHINYIHSLVKNRKFIKL
jgi:hypothetical protein